jgi:hypothetical protein
MRGARSDAAKGAIGPLVDAEGRVECWAVGEVGR